MHSRSLCGWVGLNKVIQDQSVTDIYAFYITVVIMRNMRAQLLTFQTGVFSQDLCYNVTIRFYHKRVASGMIIRLL